MTPAEQAVIDAARAWDAWRGGPTLIPRDSPESRLNAAVAALAACAPDEVNEADARAIRESPYSSYDLAPTFGVSISTIRQIRSGPSAPDEVNEASCPAGGEHRWELHEEAGTGRTGVACDECHTPQPRNENP